MSSKPVSVKAVAKREVVTDTKLRKTVATDKAAKGNTIDSFVNFAQQLGIGADNALSTAGYGFNPITRIRTMLEWIHRGSWLGGVAVDLVADDMTKGGINLLGSLKPDQMEKINECATSLGVWPALNSTIKWDRLYGGCLAVMLIDGQDYKTPLRLETVGKGQFKGLLVLDRWMVDPSLNDLVKDPGPNMGLPKFYNVTADAPALPYMKIHYSRVMRLGGLELPYWQRVQENLWGISVLERLNDRMIMFDSATTGAAQLVYKSYIRTYAIEDLRDIAAAGGPAQQGLLRYVEMMRKFQGIEGITLLDAKDKMEIMQHSAFSGLSDVLTQFGQQLSGALQIPLVRLFGQSPAGFSTGDTDLRMYYDSIEQQQVRSLKVPVTRIYRMIAQSEGIEVPDGFGVEFKNLWKLLEPEKAEIASKHTTAVIQAEEAGLISPKVAMEELKQSSRITGVFSNITDKDINDAEDVVAPPMEEVMSMTNAKDPKDPNNADEEEQEAKVKPTKTTKDRKLALKMAQDSIVAVSAMKRIHDLDVVIESPRGSLRQGGVGDEAWQVSMPADYGYVRRTTGADGDQLDCYIGSQYDSGEVWIINQVKLRSRAFDEHKVMLGFPTLESALGTYKAGFNDGTGDKRIGGIFSMSMDAFRHWLKTADLSKAV